MNHKIFIVSGGTGRTAKQVVKAALIQFPDKKPEITLFSDIRDIDKIKNIIIHANQYKALIVHTLVEDNLREYIQLESEKNNIICIDLMGNIINIFSKIFSTEPLQTPGLFNKINHEYFQRIDAIQFAFNHDDGLRSEDANKAEIILLGVSRTFKTPLSVYLAYKGYFVINIPIINGVQPPKILNDVVPSKVFCLNTNYIKLSELRGTRNEKLGKYVKDYTNIDNVKSELQFAMKYYLLHPNWNIVNVTGKPIEEIASEILETLSKKDIL